MNFSSAPIFCEALGLSGTRAFGYICLHCNPAELRSLAGSHHTQRTRSLLPDWRDMRKVSCLRSTGQPMTAVLTSSISLSGSWRRRACFVAADFSVVFGVEGTVIGVHILWGSW